MSYNGELFSLNLSFHNDGDSNLEDDDLDTELSFSYTGIENLSTWWWILFDNQGNQQLLETDLLMYMQHTKLVNSLLLLNILKQM